MPELPLPASGGRCFVAVGARPFPFGDHSGRCNYISNGADRKDVVTLMKKMIARFEGQPEIEGHD